MAFQAVAGFFALFVLAGLSIVHPQVKPTRDVAVFFDNSGSMFNQLDRQREIGRDVLAKISTNSTVSVYGFATVPNSKPLGLSLAAGAECSSDIPAIENQLTNIQVARGQTIIIDGIATASERIAGSTSLGCDNDREKILVLISDGEDRASKMKPDELIAKMKKLKIRVYVIALLDDLSGDSGFLTKSLRKKVKQFLTDLAKETDGRMAIVSKKSTATDITETLFAENYSFPK